MSVDPKGSDSFARFHPGRERLLRIAAVVALAWSCGYIGWRAVYTVAGSDLSAGIVLLAAEMLAVVVFAARVRSAIATPAAALDVPDAPMPDTTAVIDASGISVEDLRITLVSLRRVNGIDGVVIVHAEDSRWLRTVAERFDATVCDPSVGLVDAARGAGAGWVLLLRGGDLPTPDLVTMCAARCSAPDVAVVQVGTEEADPTSFDHDPDERWSREPFLQEIVRPSLAARGSVPWFGDGPVMIRRTALSHLEGVDLRDDTVRAGLALARAGLTVTHVPLALARVRGSQGLGESLVRRHRCLRSGWRAVASRSWRGVRGPGRNAHFLAVVPFLAALQRLLLVAAAVLVLGLALVPIDASAPGLVALAVPSYLLRWGVTLLLGRGRLQPFSVLRTDLRSLAVDLLPFVRTRPALERSGPAAAAVVALALGLAAGVAAVSLWQDRPDRLPAEVAAVALALTAPGLGMAIEVFLEGKPHGKRRRSRRVRLGLVTCQLEEHAGQLVGLSMGGLGVVIPDGADELPKVGDVTTVSFRIPDADGAWRSVAALVHVANRRPEPGGGTRFGLAFDDPTDEPLDPVVEFLTVDRRLVGFGRRSLTFSS